MPSLLTRADLDAIPQNGLRHEVIDGQFVMTPAPGSDHQVISTSLVTMLRNHLQGPELRVLHAPYDVVLGPHVVVPDIVVSPTTGFTAKDLPLPSLLVIGIISPSTRHLDHGCKRQVSTEAGLTYYWIVDSDDPSITTFELRDDTYTETAHAAGDQLMEVRHPIQLHLTPADLLRD